MVIADDRSVVSLEKLARSCREPRRRQFTRSEYSRLAETSILPTDLRVELLEGDVHELHSPEERVRWTCEQFERMGEVGILGPDERVELIEGDVLEMSPQNSLHAGLVTLVDEALREALGRLYVVRVQLPLRLFAGMQPEPDVAVVAPPARAYLKGHPDTALLVVEVSDTTLQFDRTVKASLYARAAIPEYWIVDVQARCLEVRREPHPFEAEAYGYGYRSMRTYHAGDEVELLLDASAVVQASTILPDASE